VPAATVRRAQNGRSAASRRCSRTTSTLHIGWQVCTTCRPLPTLFGTRVLESTTLR